MKARLALLLSSVLGGICIGLGGTVFLRLKDSFPGANVIGAFLFAVGLLTICTRGYALYTGKVCTVLENPFSYTVDVGIVWLGNFFGCALLAACFSLTSICGPDSGINVVARAMVEQKTASSYLGIFLLGIVCNIFIYIAANGYAKNPHECGKYFVLFFGVMCFILAGTEHSVANMYYWSVSGVLYEMPGESLLRILIATLGNAVGGVLFPLLERAKLRLETPAAS